MPARALGRALESELHGAALKKRGFKKLRNTFSREHDAYVEMLRIQGSGLNSGGPWMFWAKCHDGVAKPINSLGKGKPMTILYVGIDLAKSVFAVHAVNDAGQQA